MNKVLCEMDSEYDIVYTFFFDIKRQNALTFNGTITMKYNIDLREPRLNNTLYMYNVSFHSQRCQKRTSDNKAPHCIIKRQFTSRGRRLLRERVRGKPELQVRLEGRCEAAGPTGPAASARSPQGNPGSLETFHVGLVSEAHARIPTRSSGG